ncbi:hypothetical protein QMK19_17890 [Streptomyces sp. H10-C2]|uniref:tetratricopeptide repeat protein n=1 Tax=unclassified Streptomyces TaxID=2593676 RepID=UPI0024BB773B|nr:MULTISPECIES: hypothetical protein [unclassified Streptomyces]MDJ0343424.1 hypothetical protein [Streptomyces sp. PH10-H1]MDJ0371504.1 hypothetical protein [Streptomyces sp. H10-C2]
MFTALHRLAADRRDRGDHEGAVRAWNLAFGLGDLISLQAIADAKAEDGDVAGAEEVARRTVAEGDPSAWEVCARIRANQGDYDAAEGFLRRSAREGYRAAFTNLATMWDELGDRERTDAVIDEAVAAGYPRILASFAYRRESEQAYDEPLDSPYARPSWATPARSFSWPGAPAATGGWSTPSSGGPVPCSWPARLKGSSESSDGCAVGVAGAKPWPAAGPRSTTGERTCWSPWQVCTGSPGTPTPPEGERRPRI